jgi:hypothetical protein
MADGRRKDWAEMQAVMLCPHVFNPSPEDTRHRWEAIAEALWQAYENGFREGELRYLRAKGGG